MKSIEIVKLEASDDRERLLYSLNSPRPGSPVESEGFRLAGWLYMTPALEKFFDGNVYFESAQAAPKRAARNMMREDVNTHLADLGIEDAGTYGFEFNGRMKNPGQLFISGARGRLNLAKIVFRSADKARSGEAPIVALIGHSASGKSAILEQLGLDRAAHDMDFYFLKKKRKISAPAVLEWMRAAKASGPVVLSNDSELLRVFAGLKANKDAAIKGVRFVFLNRSLTRILENLKKKNTDGCFHPKKPDVEYKTIYFHFLSLYGQLADDEICYPGDELSELAERVEAYMTAVAEGERS